MPKASIRAAIIRTTSISCSSRPRWRATVTDEAVRTIPWVQPIKAAPYFAHAQFSAPDTALALAAPTDEFPYIRAMWHYARGVAHAAKGQFAEARSEAEAIAALGEQADFAPLAAAGV